MKLSDFRGIFTKSNVKLINKKQETKDIYSFEFEVNGNIKWKAGQHGIFKFINEKVSGKKTRAFSIASIKDENIIMFSTRINDKPSNFKKHLKELKIGDKLNMTGPFGWFYIKDYEKPMAMIAGGVGIPPIRALLKDIEASGKKSKKVEVFYIDSGKDYAYKSFLESMEAKYEFINVHFISERANFKKLIEEFADKYQNNANYFISGSPNMIKDVKNSLKLKGVKNKNLINDPFYGY